MSNKIAEYWIVDEVEWTNGLAWVTVAKTKTIARQRAERKLAQCEYEWAKNKESVKAEYEQAIDAMEQGTVNGPWYNHAGLKSGCTFEQYVEWGAKQQNKHSRLDCDRIMTLLHGIYLYGPSGEVVHVKETSQKARKERVRTERDTDAMVEAMAKSICGMAVK